MRGRRTRADPRRPATEARPAGEAIVWIDRDQAVIVEQRPDGRESVERLDRRSTETAAAFEARTVDEVVGEDRVAVAGPERSRIDFERAYVAVTHRPDRLLDLGSASPSDDDPLPV